MTEGTNVVGDDKYAYILVDDIRDKILWKFRHAHWLSNGCFCVREETRRDHKNEGWCSIGFLYLPKKEYEPLWDVWCPIEVVRERTKAACYLCGNSYRYE